MPNDLVPAVGLVDALEVYRQSRLEGAMLGLFEGPHVPGSGDTLATYQGALETTFGGYSEQSLAGWTTSVLQGTIAQTQSPIATFTPSATPGTHTITGYFLFKSSTLLGAGQLNNPISVQPNTAIPLIVVRTEQSP